MLLQDTGIEEYAKAIPDTLMNRSTQFYGASYIIKIRVINAPLTSDNIAKPKIVYKESEVIQEEKILTNLIMYDSVIY